MAMPRSVDEVDVDLGLVADGGGTHDGADGGGHPAPLADDATHVAVGDRDGEGAARVAGGLDDLSNLIKPLIRLQVSAGGAMARDWGLV